MRSNMTNLKTIAAVSAAMAVIACGSLVFAQDDLDDLLKDLESDLAAETAGAQAVEAEPEAEPKAVPEVALEEEASEAESEESAEEEPEAEPEVEPEVEPEAEPEADTEVPAEEESAPEAEEPVEEEDTSDEVEPAVEPAVAPETEPEVESEEPVEAEEPAVEEATEEPIAEEPAIDAEETAPADEEPAPAAEEPAPVAEEPAQVAEEPAPVAEEPEAITTEQVDAAISLLADIAASEISEEDAAPADAPVVAKPAPAKSVETDPDAELLANITATEKLRRSAYDAQAKREVVAARSALSAGDNLEASKRYALALKLLNDSPATKKLRRECEQGIAESLYRAAMEEDRIGRRGNAIEVMNRALAMRHPKARKQLEEWNTTEDPNANKKALSDLKHRRNEDSYKAKREKNQRHLKRARQLLAVKEIDEALDECELVLVNDPYNQEAIRLRNAIQKKRAVILGQEFKVTREAMIADVDRAWRPVYAPNARDIDEASSSTVKRALGEDPERTIEQSIKQRMKEMVLPQISFKPPATIIDAINFFRLASKDYDRPDIPLEERGFNFVIKSDKLVFSKAAAPEVEDENNFSDDGDDDSDDSTGVDGIPVIQTITATNIPFDEALQLVCESVKYKYIVRGRIIMIMPEDETTEEMLIRNYPVMSTFMEKMDSASSEISEGGFGVGSRSKKNDNEDDDSQEAKLKSVFEQLGVSWPEGSRIFYMSATGKLRVKNTEKNLSEIEKALVELHAEQKLVEIEARFVEVGQEDLNSLGFEWILNSDYTLAGGGWLARKLGVKEGGFVPSSSDGISTASETVSGGAYYTSKSASNGTINGTWASAPNGNITGRTGSVGINAMGGSDAEYGNGNRYLSTTGNHISGNGKSTNDQFMRVNAFLGSADLSMILHMLSQRSDTDLLSAPKVLTRPDNRAVIEVITEYRYPQDYEVQTTSGSSSSSSSSSGQSSVLAIVKPENFTTQKVGVILEVEPKLTDAGNLIDLNLKTQIIDEPTWKNYGMRIPFTANSRSGDPADIAGIVESVTDAIANLGTSLTTDIKDMFTEKLLETSMTSMENMSKESSLTYYEAPMEQPFFHMRTIESTVSIYPGATIVMGGLITESRKAMDDKVPFLGDLPFIGRLFRSHAEQTVKKNLLIFLTTRLVDVRGREVSVGDNESASDPEVKAAPEAQ